MKQILKCFILIILYRPLNQSLLPLFIKFFSEKKIMQILFLYVLAKVLYFLLNKSYVLGICDYKLTTRNFILQIANDFFFFLVFLILSQDVFSMP